MTIGYILAIWLVTFLVVFFPAGWIGKWMAGHKLPVPFGVIACLKVTLIFIMLVSSFLVVMRFESLPHVNSDKRGFVYFLATLLFGVPAFVALLLGFIRARKLINNSSNQTTSA